MAIPVCKDEAEYWEDLEQGNYMPSKHQIVLWSHSRRGRQDIAETGDGEVSESED